MEKYGVCDRGLWEKLARLVGYNQKCVHCIEKSKVLPDDTLFYDAMSSYTPGSGRVSNRPRESIGSGTP
jgi:hypothetical protein